ncbi:uncharacterized protein STEHIDRAFT_123185 [Stereum hirsutum FP-91666 SS1]|uniref:uncharacterized protein n=1 Tax=Stereum hirsutum (strain FP-91666) TaxID=721885 RepID=UPI0004449869|nr:uncharacterized protein STEHIDRAFT_123185 [Stereum hirsutum FP-91666 SS1]EIM84372.1 hypothetical protein STEHIDRAFT_123185 [Stereum hirsutum FP-91666 SS1]
MAKLTVPRRFTRPRTMPKNLYVTTVTTLTLGIILFIFSLLDLATAGFFLNVTGAGLTILHDATLLHLARRSTRHHPYPSTATTPSNPGADNDDDELEVDYFRPSASFANLAVLGSCIVVLLAGFAMTVFTMVGIADDGVAWGSPASMGTVVVQAVLDLVIAGLLGAVQMESFRMWRRGAHGGGYGQLAL